MKTREDPRHKKRQRIISDLFSLQFHNQKVSDIAKEVINYKSEIDELIQKAAPDFPVDKINRIDLAILRLAIYEIMYYKKEPQNVLIDEAVELAKEYGSETSAGFVNGVLGKIVSYGKSS